MLTTEIRSINTITRSLRRNGVARGVREDGEAKETLFRKRDSIRYCIVISRVRKGEMISQHHWQFLQSNYQKKQIDLLHEKQRILKKLNIAVEQLCQDVNVAESTSRENEGDKSCNLPISTETTEYSSIGNMQDLDYAKEMQRKLLIDMRIGRHDLKHRAELSHQIREGMKLRGRNSYFMKKQDLMDCRLTEDFIKAQKIIGFEYCAEYSTDPRYTSTFHQLSEESRGTPKSFRNHAIQSTGLDDYEYGMITAALSEDEGFRKPHDLATPRKSEVSPTPPLEVIYIPDPYSFQRKILDDFDSEQNHTVKRPPQNGPISLIAAQTQVNTPTSETNINKESKQNALPESSEKVHTNGKLNPFKASAAPELTDGDSTELPFYLRLDNAPPQDLNDVIHYAEITRQSSLKKPPQRKNTIGSKFGEFIHKSARRLSLSSKTKAENQWMIPEDSDWEDEIRLEGHLQSSPSTPTARTFSKVLNLHICILFCFPC
ncbi:hypothetical protein BKA69DRAFT_103675 [Paraphysoderma sedebokerense]|nr:hypothetical protein BKA69DRAFT_103675 [Paraphysoderma sedebokerense]